MRGRRKRFDWAVLSAKAGKGREQHSDAPAATIQTSVADPGRDLRGAVDAAAVPLRVNDLKQYAYCPRIVFYQYAMPVSRRATFKMEHGKSVEPRLEQLEQRRKLREYGLDRGERRFQVWLQSSRWNLSGRLDLLIETPEGPFPVDFKDTLAPVQQNHRVQLCAYVLILEDVTGRTVPRGFIYRVPGGAVSVVEMTKELRAETVGCIEAMRRMLVTERMPPPTPVRARCEDCEYRNYCGDIF